MPDALSIAANGINASVARATQAAADIVKASSTGKNLETNLVKIKTESVSVAADAAAIKAEKKMRQSLLDILA